MKNFTALNSISVGGLGLSVLLASSPAQALDFTTWDAAGDVSVADSSGTLTNAFPGDDGAVNFNVSPNNPVSVGELESFLNLPLNTLNGSATEGSAIKQTFNARAGDQLSFNWQFLTNESNIAFPDYSFVTINSDVNVLATIVNAVNATIPSSSFARQTSINAFSYSFPVDGTYTIGIGVVDAGFDNVTSSALQIGNVSDPSTIPTPALLPGLIGFSYAALRRRQAL